MRKMITLLSIPMVLAVLAGATAPTGLLDGRHYVGDIGDKGQEKGKEAELIFKDGKLIPLGHHRLGFAPAPYTATREGGVTSFAAEHANARGDRMRWEGTVETYKLAGTMTYWEGTQPPREHWFRGELIH